MAAALFLSRAGHRVHLFERFAAPRPLGSGLLLQPTGLAVLAELGLRARIEAAGARIERLVGRVVPSGRTILDVAYADLGPGLAGIGIHRANLFEALHAAVAGGGIDILSDSAIESIEPAADGRPVLVGPGRPPAWSLRARHRRIGRAVGLARGSRHEKASPGLRLWRAVEHGPVAR